MRGQATLEASIHAFEGSYLSDALLPATTAVGNTNAQFGNIIKGCSSFSLLLSLPSPLVLLLVVLVCMLILCSHGGGRRFIPKSSRDRSRQEKRKRERRTQGLG